MAKRYDTYKDSGIQWLGEIPEHWSRCTNSKLLEAIQDGTHGSFQRVDYGKPLLSAKNISEKGITITEEESLISDIDYQSIIANGFPKKGDIAFCSVGSIGKCCLYNLDVSHAFQRSVTFLRYKNNYISLYFLFALKAIPSIAQFNALLKKSAIGGIYMGDIKRIYMPLPPLSEQQAIVSYLDDKCGKIDEWLDKKKKEVEHLQELKQRVIADAVTRGLNPDVKMKATNIPWLPEIPEHWDEKRMASLFTGDIESNKNFEYKRAFKFNYGQLVPKNEVGDPEEYREVYTKYSIVKKGDILVNGLNLNYDFISQRVACAPYEGIITSAYVVCRPREGVNYDYYTWLFKGMDSMKLFHGMGTGIRLTLSFKEIKKQIIPVPPLSEQKQIVSYITEKTTKIDTLVANINKEIENIKEYKQRLISDVVTGQIKVCKC